MHIKARINKEFRQSVLIFSALYADPSDARYTMYIYSAVCRGPRLRHIYNSVPHAPCCAPFPLLCPLPLAVPSPRCSAVHVRTCKGGGGKHRSTCPTQRRSGETSATPHAGVPRRPQCDDRIRAEQAMCWQRTLGSIYLYGVTAPNKNHAGKSV